MDSTTRRSRFQPGAIRKPIGLALQGGGSWGAFTWGVLDAFLANGSFAVAQLSGTSAGAINAAIVAGALAKGAPARARQALRSFWLSIADQAGPGIIGGLWGPLERQWWNSLNEWMLACGMLPPSHASAFAVELLRSAIAKHVDVEAIRSRFAPALFVTVTNVKTGLPRVISNDAMSIDALLASACIPDLFPAVEIDGEWYWDGGYGGNPTLWPMIRAGASRDLIIVQLMRDRIEELPTGTLGVRRRVGEIVFNSSLVAEMQAISAMRGLAEPRHAAASVANVRLHRVGPPPVALFDQGSGIDRTRPWLQLLHDEGFAAGKQFMADHGADIGIRETLDVARAFLDTNKPRIPLPGTTLPRTRADFDRGGRSHRARSRRQARRLATLLR
jgi:NTE family protein